MSIAEALSVMLARKASDHLLQIRKEAKDARMTVDDSRFREALGRHLQGVETWSQTITLLALLRDKRLQDSFTELTLTVGYGRFGQSPATNEALLTIEDVYQQSRSAALLGGPGAGKTTSLKRIAQLALASRDNTAMGVPILVRLREITSVTPLIPYLLYEMGVSLWSHERHESDVAKWQARTLIALLEKIDAVVLLDGLDEVDPTCRLAVESHIGELIERSQRLRVILTCRTAEYRLAISSLQPFTIRPLSREPVTIFAKRWLGTDKAPAFVDAVDNAPYAGTEVVPLTLAHYCALYERYGELPEKPLDVYEQVVSLFIEDWDRQRGLTRKSDYADFPPRKKERFLQAIAYQLTTRGARGGFDETELLSAYDAIAPDFSLPPSYARQVVQEVESHTGLVLQTGHRRFEFFHLTIQEYLTAMYAQRTPSAILTLLPKYPDELALVVTASANAPEYLAQITQELLKEQYQPSHIDDFLAPLFSRLATEHARMSGSAELGWTLIALMSICLNSGRRPWSLSVRTNAIADSRSARTPLFALADVRRSVATALKNATLHVVDNGAWVTPRNFRENFPSYLAHALKDRRIDRLMIPPALVPKRKK
jgi:hypothetical protein